MLKSVFAKIRPVHLIMALVFAIGLLVTGTKFLDAKEIGLILDRLEWWAVAPLLMLPIAYLWLKSARFADMFALSGPSLEPRQKRRTVMSCYASAQMATLLPGGYVARIGLVQSALGKGTQAVMPTLLEKLIDITLLLIAGLYACCLHPGMESLAAMLLTILVLLTLLCASSTIRAQIRDCVIFVVSKVGGRDLIEQALKLNKPRPGLAAKLGIQSLMVLLCELTILVGCFLALGLRADLVVVILAYAVADVLGRVAPTPGGFGLTEVGMVAFLHNFDGMALNEAAAVTFLFRFLLFLLPAFYGCLCYLYFLPSVEGSAE